MASAETISYDCQPLGPGWIGLALKNDTCVGVALPATEHGVSEHFAERFPLGVLQRKKLTQLDDLIALATGEITAYPHPFLAQGTAFQQAVWQGLLSIAPGQTQSYQQLANTIKRPTAVRAVGSGCGANPLAVIIPCHRVTRSDGQLGGFYWGLEWKQFLLANEQRAAHHFI